jgi:hypothetical protein
MDLETAVGYLAALAVPLWLLVEQAVSWRRSAKQVETRVEHDLLSTTPVSSPPVKPGRAPAMRLAQQRKIA